jgi:hypothetical protein
VVSIADLLEIYEMYVNNGHKFNGNW